MKAHPVRSNIVVDLRDHCLAKKGSNIWLFQAMQTHCDVQCKSVTSMFTVPSGMFKVFSTGNVICKTMKPHLVWGDEHH